LKIQYTKALKNSDKKNAQLNRKTQNLI